MDKTNQLMELANGEKFAVLKQFNQPEGTYYFTVGVTDDEENLTDEYVFFKETKKDGKVFMEQVDDPDILSKLDFNPEDFEN